MIELATKLKKEAVRHQLLFVQKNYSAGIPNKKAMELCIKYQGHQILWFLETGQTVFN